MILLERIDRIAVAVGADHLVFVHLILYGYLACLSLRRRRVHVVVVTHGLAVEVEEDPFGLLGVVHRAVEQLPKTAVNRVVALIRAARVGRLAFGRTLVERVAFLPLGLEIHHGLGGCGCGVPTRGVVRLVDRRIVAGVAFERRPVVERRGCDPERHDLQRKAGAFLHAAELIHQVLRRDAGIGLVAVAADLLDDRMDVLAFERRQCVGVYRIVDVGAFAVAFQHAVVQVGADEEHLADTLRKRAGACLGIRGVVLLDTFEDDVGAADVFVEFGPEGVAGAGVGRGVARGVELGTRFPVAVVELVGPPVLGRRAFAFVRERRVAEETDVYERLVGGAGVEVEPVDQAFCLVETREYVLIRFVALRGLVEEILAGSHQRDCKAATEQI